MDVERTEKNHCKRLFLGIRLDVKLGQQEAIVFRAAMLPYYSDLMLVYLNDDCVGKHN